jgi:hypothetical protein
MKKVLLTLIKVFLSISLSFIGLYFVYKSMVKNNLESQLNTVNNNWKELLKLQDEKTALLKILVKNSPVNIKYLDSLNINLVEYDEKRKKIGECNSSWAYEQYLSNKYMMSLINFYIVNKQLGGIEKEKLLSNIRIINRVITKYNSSVKVYNLYYSTFPNFIIAKSYGYKRKNYFDIQFGSENIDPKVSKKERRDWQRKIEMEHGVSE